jgi:ABC-type microcin C transport system duplicated ATPase subunit YejF
MLIPALSFSLDVDHPYVPCGGERNRLMVAMAKIDRTIALVMATSVNRKGMARA